MAQARLRDRHPDPGGELQIDGDGFLAHMSTRRYIRLGKWVAVGAVALALGAWALDALHVPPRALGPYLERRASGHNPTIEGFGKWAARTLLALDRLDMSVAPPQALPFIPPFVPPVPAEGRVIFVKDADEVSKAVEAAQPGDIITLMPGTYAFAGGRGRIDASGAGRAGREIVVRAARPGTVKLEFDLVEGFKVSGAYWMFEGLEIRGTCKEHRACEHAFHVVGAAHHFVARGNRISDFNAHFKINAENGAAPDSGMLEGNVLTNSAVRATANPVTPIDLVAASNWVMRGNAISDFVKGEGDRVSYAGYAKGGGANNRFEQNLVVCENFLRGQPGSRVGLSLGGGGTGQASCRDQRCIVEQQGGVIQANLIMACSDDGIYLNKAAASVVRHNTLIDTGPVAVRFPETSADLEGNLLDASIQARDGGVAHAQDNRQTGMSSLYVGRHPVRALFADPARFDFRWAGAAPLREETQAPTQTQAPLPDLCGGERAAQPAYGASDDYSRCMRTVK
jgi:hypothetical protein